MSYLDSNTFATVVENTPLISIDLIIRNSKNEVLLGRRLNSPARGFWFTPGGRIYKNETMSDAFTRIIHDETGLTRTITDARFIGPYEHFYNDSAMSSNISTHYVVLVYEINADINFSDLPRSQHSEYRLAPVQDLMDDDTLHAYVKLYFEKDKNSI